MHMMFENILYHTRYHTARLSEKGDTCVIIDGYVQTESLGNTKPNITLPCPGVNDIPFLVICIEVYTN